MYAAAAMTRPWSLAAPAVLLLAVPTAFGQAGGAIVYENGSPDMGSSYAGANARAQDAATVFQNPAGMTRLEENQLLVGGMLVFADVKFDFDAGNSVTVPPGQTNDGGQAGQFSPGLGSFMSFKLSDSWRLGFAVNALVANGVDYDPAWVGRTAITENQFIVANIEPALAYRVNDWLSVGAGLNIVYGSLDQRLRAGSGPLAPEVEIDDADDWAFGGTFGALFEPREGTRIGLTYRTEIELDLSGDLRNPTPMQLNFDTEFPLPQGANLSLFQQLNDQWALLADVGWTDWSTFDYMPTTVGPLSGAIRRNWSDTYRLGVGFQYQFLEDWMLRGGFGFDSSPADDDEVLPDIPVGDQYRLSVGVQRDFGDGKIFGLSYTFMYSDIEMDRVALPPGGAVILSGEYENAYIHFLGVNMSITF